MSGFLPDQPGAEVRVSPNFGPRRETLRPDMIVLHYTGMDTGPAAEAWLCDPASEVSSHYLVHEDGRVVQMVRESDRAWHAGKSSWFGRTDINSCSVGIEIVNPGHALGYKAFPKRQVDAVIGLCAGIVGRHSVPPQRVLAHSDVAPGRKVDPGEKFPWQALFAAGIGHLVPAAPVRPGTVLKAGDCGTDVEALQSMLALYGYGVEITGDFDRQTEVVVAAFQRHFRRRLVDGAADDSTICTLQRLLASVKAASSR
ncbi:MULTISPECIES: N-acetylmuramoyl-L-alanine amidase [unclassified Mesorhizobium]|uniref:peptidoglycan recognition protein family protein n=1 Tax=unclassified Mesorhizobium TaxID=325217 RepID=UPI000BB089C3|nr:MULTISPECIES: N-acetylmuramoyl-L-alanine amidase [unclassified Mesorhizobium]TGT58729.1 N-acetylmuramoyl-L-alanine amidase [Mesorhizobium sp. M00.F.Ca.ET.170.01.1.1]AZO12200.1 N-acetylmuramoyl-L-alanine amidase [Mesorhizobium sp. M3A.F.Ca.ET.080.04.2.1]PBB84810.1 N-acetylmuramoyl-L-alanine amidase [Mesorhizobium sp. WSM3876]RWB74912.1 MAG: N-acetylmuramoyl-L-alanine amidase [Mesorhizobium sp.]RWB89626.1 MAG: N-acetylmuramoyl-L-alanine amidase [Mesorhizobium sp.]